MQNPLLMSYQPLKLPHSVWSVFILQCYISRVSHKMLTLHSFKSSSPLLLAVNSHLLRWCLTFPKETYLWQWLGSIVCPSWPFIILQLSHWTSMNHCTILWFFFLPCLSDKNPSLIYLHVIDKISGFIRYPKSSFGVNGSLELVLWCKEQRKAKESKG